MPRRPSSASSLAPRELIIFTFSTDYMDGTIGPKLQVVSPMLEIKWRAASTDAGSDS